MSKSKKQQQQDLEDSRLATLAKLEPFFRYGVGIRTAVRQYNAKTNWTDYISHDMIQDWYTDIPAIADIVDSWTEMPDMQAHKTWVDAMRAGNYQAARDWLKVKKPDEFGEKEPSAPGAKVLVEFATAPSPFMGPTDQATVKVHVDTVDRKEKVREVKKKSSPSKRKKPPLKKAPSTRSTAKKSSSETKTAGGKPTESKKQ